MSYFFHLSDAYTIHRASSVVLLTSLDFTLQEVLRSFDVVGLLERFDETLLMVADAVGIQRLLYTRLIPRTTNPRIRKPNFTSVCPDEARCRAHIATVGWADHVIYDEAKTAFERRLSQLGAPFAARVAEFKRARAAWAGRTKSAGNTRSRMADVRTAMEHRVDMRRLHCPLGASVVARHACRLLHGDTSYRMNWRYTEGACRELLDKCNSDAATARAIGGYRSPCRTWKLGRAQNKTRDYGRMCAAPRDDEAPVSA